MHIPIGFYHIRYTYVMKMSVLIGVRREDKNRWERRAPLIPEHVKELKDKHSIECVVQPSKIRVFSDEEYAHAGAKVQDDLSPCSIIFAIKEIPQNFFEHGKTYIFFSHTIKGQKHNMPMLGRILDLKCTLIDYEKIVDEEGHRLIFFGRYAGIAGMIDTLWALGRKLDLEGISVPFSKIRQALHYESLKKAKKEITKIGKKIATDGIPKALSPLICGFGGYGNVSKGAQEILDLLPMKEVEPEKIDSLYANPSTKHIYKVVFEEKDMVEPLSGKFELSDYYEYPEKYRSKFESYIPHLTIFMNCIYWNGRYPRFVTKKYIRHLFEQEEKPRLKVIGDISCDIGGSIEFTSKCTNPGNPVFIYDSLEDRTIDGFEGNGVVVIAVDNLPCELPRESSTYFSKILFPFVLEIAQADFSSNFDECDFPLSIKNAVIAYKGELTPNYKYLHKYVGIK